MHGHGVVRCGSKFFSLWIFILLFCFSKKNIKDMTILTLFFVNISYIIQKIHTVYSEIYIRDGLIASRTGRNKGDFTQKLFRL